MALVFIINVEVNWVFRGGINSGTICDETVDWVDRNGWQIFRYIISAESADFWDIISILILDKFSLLHTSPSCSLSNKMQCDSGSLNGFHRWHPTRDIVDWNYQINICGRWFRERSGGSSWPGAEGAMVWKLSGKRTGIGRALESETSPKK